MYEELFGFLNQYDGFRSSFAAKEAHRAAGLEGDTGKMTYGEFNAVSFTDMIETLKKHINFDERTDLKVIDLGSGIGKVCVALHYCGLFKSVYGCELLKGLYDDSLKLLHDYSEKFKKDISNVEIFNSKSEDIDFSNYDVFVTNNPINEDYIRDVRAKFNVQAKTGAILISTITQYRSEKIKPIESIKTNFSWGDSTLYFSIIQ